MHGEMDISGVGEAYFWTMNAPKWWCFEVCSSDRSNLFSFHFVSQKPEQHFCQPISRIWQREALNFGDLARITSIIKLYVNEIHYFER